ncbi:MurT ligase domain-containing protein, partial [uncultured Clostridium sp.]
TAGIPSSKLIIEEDYEKLTSKIKNGKNKKLYVLATYTAMINYRKYLYSKGYIKNLW